MEEKTNNKLDLKTLEANIQNSKHGVDTLGHSSSTFSTTEEEDGAKRGSWNSHIEFFLSLVGACVGLGNVWRFPYLCYKFGGGAFLIPYVISLICCGVPMYFMEVSLGQYFGTGCISLWKISPIFKGIGYGIVVLASYCNVYFVVIICWTLFYLGMSFRKELLWGTCDNYWNKETCVSPYERLNLTCWNDTINSEGTLCNLRNLTAVPIVELTDPVKEFWENRVLQVSSGIDNPGVIQWELAISLLVAWIMCYFCIWKGVEWTGKVVYFTALFPYVCLIILFIRGITLPGAMTGIKFYLIPDLEKIMNVTVWMEALSQVFWSYALGFGSIIALGSYNKFENDSHKDAIYLCIINGITSFFCGFVVFSVIGFMAEEQQKPISEVAAAGPGLAFLAYPTAVLQLPVSPFWSALFFIMILLMGLDSEFCTIEGVVTALVDVWPKQLQNHKEMFILAVSIISYLLGLSMVTQGGIYVFTLFNEYAVSGICLIYMVLLECVAVAWGYGADKFFDNIKEMIGYTPFIWWKICWKYITPLCTLAVLILNFISWKSPTYINYEYPFWAHVLGFVLAASSMLCVPVYAIYIYSVTPHEGSWNEKLYSLVKPKLDVEEIKNKNRDTSKIASTITLQETFNN